MRTNIKNTNNEKQQIINLYLSTSQKFLTKGKIKESTLNKIMEDINANCKEKK